MKKYLHHMAVAIAHLYCTCAPQYIYYTFTKLKVYHSGLNLSVSIFTSLRISFNNFLVLCRCIPDKTGDHCSHSCSLQNNLFRWIAVMQEKQLDHFLSKNLRQSFGHATIQKYWFLIGFNEESSHQELLFI